jgi:hypothetical protein
MNTRRALGLVASALALTLASAACSIPADERVTPIGPGELGPDLLETTTTTSTTTTTTAAPQTTEPGAPSTTTTTTVPIPTTNVTAYYTIANTDSMQFLVQPLSGVVPLAAVVGLLETPVADLRQYNLRSSVRRGLIDVAQLAFDADRAELTVGLDGAVFEAMSEEQRRRAIGQIVLTFTSFSTSDAGNIGSVRFTVDGAPISIVIPETNSATTEGEPVTFADFRSLLGTTTGAVPTATTPPQTTTTLAETPLTSAPAP